MDSPAKLLFNSFYGKSESEIEKLLTSCAYGESTAILASWFAEQKRQVWESITDGGEIAL